MAQKEGASTVPGLADLPHLAELTDLAQQAAGLLVDATVSAAQEAESLLAKSGNSAAAALTQPIHSVLDDVRSASDYTEQRILSAARQRLHEYHPKEAEIAALTRQMAEAGKSAAEIARWAVEARNRLRQELREKGDPLVQAVAELTRGTGDMPTYDMLRARGKSDAEIIASAARSNGWVDGWAVAAEVAVPLVGDALESAESVIILGVSPTERTLLIEREAERAEAALAGGRAGEKEAAELASELAASVAAGDSPLAASIASVVGGIAGAVSAGRTKSRSE